MKQAEIKQELHKHFKKITSLYNDMLEEFELETIHDFRVEIKRIRAFVRLLNSSVQGEDRIKLSAGLRACYGFAGEIRNLQLHKKRIIELCQNLEVTMPASYLSILSAEEAIKKQGCRNTEKDVSLKDIEQRTISHVHHILHRKDINTYMNQKRKALESFLLLPFLSDDDLHGLRKILKDLSYNWAYVIADIKLLPQFFTHKKNIEELTIRLGDFYDLCMANDFLCDDYIAAVGEEEKNLCYLLKGYFEENKNNLKELIISILYAAAYGNQEKRIIVEVFNVE